MEQSNRHGDLEIDQNLEFQQRDWVVERVGWAFGAVVLLLAMLGLFGGAGPLAHYRAERDGLEVVFSRFARDEGIPRFEVTAAPELATDGLLRLALAQSVVERLYFERIEPRPERVSSNGAEVIYEFRVESPRDPLRIRFQSRPALTGALRGHLRVIDGPQVPLSMYVYP